MSQWAEIRHLHLVEGLPKKEIARRLHLDVKTVRRAVDRPTPPVRVSPARPSSLAPWRAQIEQWLRDDRKLTAKRIRRLLLPLAGAVSPRTVRRYVATLRRSVTSKEAFVHRSVAPGTTMEVDFGESWVDIAGTPCKVKYLVATLPFSNAYFAKAYPVERLESLLDGIESAFAYFGGVVERVVLDNTSLAVKDVLAGRDRVQTEAFEAFRGAYPFRAEFCAPAKGWEKGSVETGVKYVRNLVFRPRLAVESWAALNQTVLAELEADLPTRHLDDGRTAQEALTLEQQHLRSMPAHLPATCRVVARVADKFGHVRVEHITYSVPIRCAYQPVWVKLYHDRVAVAVGADVVAEHGRAFCRGSKVLDPFHVLPLLERKHRAVAEATALVDWRLAPVWQQVRDELAKHTRKPDQEWVRMLRLMETHPAASVERAVTAALERQSPRLETVRLILRQQQAGPPPVCRPVSDVRPELAQITVPVPMLAAYDSLVEGAC
jgi:transposase